MNYFGANDGTRTRDNQNHNLGLYQLSYVRRRRSEIIAFLGKNPLKRAYCAVSSSKAAQSPRQRLASRKKSAIASLLCTFAKA